MQSVGGGTRYKQVQRPGAAAPSPIRPSPPEEMLVRDPATIKDGQILDCRFQLERGGPTAVRRCVVLAIVPPLFRKQTRIALRAVRSSPGPMSLSVLCECMKIEDTLTTKRDPYKVSDQRSIILFLPSLLPCSFRYL